MGMTAQRETYVRYGKPSLTDLPYELGKSIIDQIMNTPAPDFSDTEQEVQRVKTYIQMQKEKKAVKA